MDKVVLLYNTSADGYFPSDFIGKYHVHILCLKGMMQFDFANQTFQFKENDFAIWQLGSEINNVLYSTDFEADFLLVERQFLLEYNPETLWATKAYVYIKRNPLFHLDAQEMELVKADFHSLRQRNDFERHLFYKEILGRELQIFLFDLWHIYERELKKQEGLSNTSAGLFNRFMDLVRQNSTENREVNFYSDKLCVTPKYLSEVIRKGSGYPASYWINAFAAQEIVRLLKTTDMPIQHISDKMHFYNLSHFSRFTKRMLGMSPTAYREKGCENRQNNQSKRSDDFME